MNPPVQEVSLHEQQEDAALVHFIDAIKLAKLETRMKRKPPVKTKPVAVSETAKDVRVSVCRQKKTPVGCDTVE
jgi:hypothetical protein